jgi:hypothetical protein
MVAKSSAGWRRVERGFTPAQRWVVRFEDGSSCFVKAGDDVERPGAYQTTAYGLRREHHVYYQLSGAAFMPRMLAWHDEPGLTILILEDLSDAFWPPPWTSDRVASVLETLSAVHAAPVEDALDAAENVAVDTDPASWEMIQASPDEFLALGLCSADWLAKAAPRLTEHEQMIGPGGDDFCHFDVRSDNICFAGDRALLIDWNWAARGDGQVDIAFWLPSLHMQGGPPPEAILPDAPALAALVSGFFACRAGRPVIPAMPRVRDFQKEQLMFALPWAVRALNLPPLDGPNAPA